MSEGAKGYLNLFLAVFLAALATPVVKWLVEHGGRLGLSNPGAISYCNVLFVGNLLAGAVVLFHTSPRRMLAELRRCRTACKLYLAASIAVAGALVPVAMYYAIESTSIANLLLLTRVEAVAFTALAVLLFGDAVTRMNWIGLGVIVAGSVVLSLWQGGGRVSGGDALALLTGVLYACGSILARYALRDVSMPTFLFARNLVGAIVFFVIALVLYGPHHFGDAFAGELWVAMAVYATTVVVLGQVTWFQALAALPSGTVSAWYATTPVVGIAIAHALLNERPDLSQWVGMAIIVGGVLLSQLGTRSEPRAIDRSIAAG